MCSRVSWKLEFNFTHTLGRIPIVTVDTGNHLCAANISLLSSTQISVTLYNQRSSLAAIGTVRFFSGRSMYGISTGRTDRNKEDGAVL